jgi:hypothetical protein
MQRCILVVPVAARGPMSESEHVQDCGEWSAVHDHMPPLEEPMLRVHSVVTFRTRGYTWTLEHGQQGINPQHLRLEFTVIPPTEPSGDALDPQDVTFEEPTLTEYDKVEIYGACDATVDVTKVSKT